MDKWDYQQNSIQSGDKMWLKGHVVQSVILWNLCSHEVNLEPTFGDRVRAWIYQFGGHQTFRRESDFGCLNFVFERCHGFGKQFGQTSKQ